MSPAEQKLYNVQEELKRRGVRDVKFFWAPNAFEAGYEKVVEDVATFLEAYLEGRFTVVTKLGL